MKINFISDVHVEFGVYDHQVPDDADVVVIAGDLAPGLTAIDWLDDLNRKIKQPIIYVPGNHCFYHTNLHYWIQQLESHCKQIGVEFLYRSSTEVKGVVFVGGTMWTAMNIAGDAGRNVLMAPRLMSDYKYIHGHYGLLSPEEVIDEHEKTVAFFDSELSKHAGKQCVVVTHHAPSGQSLTYRESGIYSPYYATDLEDTLIKKHNPALWIHGHIHITANYQVGSTKIRSNPRGYAGHELNDQFNPGIIEDI